MVIDLLYKELSGSAVTARGVFGDILRFLIKVRK
jgi:hypothetical protein